MNPHPVYEASLRLQRTVICVVVVLGVIAFGPAGNDGFGLPKATVIAVGAVLIVAIALLRVFSTGRVVIPWSAAVVAAGMFLLIAAVATLTSDTISLSLVGHYTRYSGLVIYVMLFVLFVATIRSFTIESTRTIAWCVLAGGAVVGAYGLLQWIGVDPFEWTGEVQMLGITSTAGNPNFVAGHLAIAAPAAVWAAIDRRSHIGVRVVGAVVAAAILLAIVPTRSDQGWLASGVGLTVLALAWISLRRPRERRIGFGLLGVGGVAVVGAVGAGLAWGWGPIATIAEKGSTQLRLFDISAAISMTVDRPLTGVGFDRYGAWYGVHRPPESTLWQGLEHATLTPHSVPLHFFAGGGLPLGIAYLAFVAIVAFILILGLVRLEGDSRLLLGCVGGSWAAYQAQSAVSIDMPGLAMLGWVLAGAVLVVAGKTQTRSFVIPGIPEPQETRAERRRKSRDRAPSWSVRDRVVTGAVGVFALLGVWLVIIPLRADMAYKWALSYEHAGVLDRAVVEASKATDLGPWEPLYTLRLATYHYETGNADLAAETVERARKKDERRLIVIMNQARLAVGMGEFEEAERAYMRAIEIEPHHPQLKLEVARFLVDRDQGDQAVLLVGEVLDLNPGNADAWAVKGVAAFNAGNEDEARALLERALELNPEQQDARRLLAAIEQLNDTDR